MFARHLPVRALVATILAIVVTIVVLGLQIAVFSAIGGKMLRLEHAANAPVPASDWCW